MRTPKVEVADVDVKDLEPLLVHAKGPAEMQVGLGTSPWIHRRSLISPVHRVLQRLSRIVSLL